MAGLFEQGAIGTLTLKNRIIRSATWEGMCDPDGRPTRKLADCYAGLVKGGAGLIISGYTYVRPEGKQLAGKMGIHSDAFASDFQALARTVHDLGGKIAVQLVHAGGQADPKTTRLRSVAPSEIRAGAFPETPRALSVLEIEAITDAFGQAAFRAKAWGVDAIQIHGAHGYLVNQFLSPFTNLRTDAYGGTLENRSRFLFDIYEKIRGRVGKHFPVFIKLSGADHVENGLTATDALKVAGRLDAQGIDAIEVSSGMAASGDMGPARKKINSQEKEAYNLCLARGIKAAVSCPVISVGGIRSRSVAEAAIEKHGMDFIALARPLIREPDLPHKWETHTADKSACISCNKCFIPGITRGGIYCVAQKKGKPE